MDWTNKVTKLSHKLLREMRRIKTTYTPDPADLQKMAMYLKSKLNNFSLKVSQTTAETF